jgi:hypothetical protein
MAGSSTISLRNLPPALHRLIRRRARERGISLNRAVIELLEARSRPQQAPAEVHDDLDFLIGSWTEEEGDSFDQELARQREIDPELWR